MKEDLIVLIYKRKGNDPQAIVISPSQPYGSLNC